MTLVSSSTMKGADCPVCGKAARACGPEHSGVNIVDTPQEGTMTKPATHLAEARINGQTVTIRTDLDTAKARGWTILGPFGADAFHKARGVTPAGPAGTAGTVELEAMSRAELLDLARDRGITGVSRLNRAQLAEALTEPEA